MRYHRDDIVRRAIDVLDAWGLPDLSMRRLGAELGVQPSALYHHFPSKQRLLAAVADELVSRGLRTTGQTWEEQIRTTCSSLRDALLAYRDGGEVVATTWAFGLGARAPYDALLAALGDAGLGRSGSGEPEPETAARTLLHYVYGHVVDEQTQVQAASLGAIEAEVREFSDFADGLELIVAGIRESLAKTRASR